MRFLNVSGVSRSGGFTSKGRCSDTPMPGMLAMPGNPTSLTSRSAKPNGNQPFENCSSGNTKMKYWFAVSTRRFSAGYNSTASYSSPMSSFLMRWKSLQSW